MKRTAIVAITLLLITACAVTPQELAEQGERVEFTAQLPPVEAAQCMARNARNAAPGGTPVATSGEKPKSAEFFMAGNFYAVLTPHRESSNGLVWIQRTRVHDLPGIWQQIIKGC